MILLHGRCSCPSNGAFRSNEAPAGSPGRCGETSSRKRAGGCRCLCEARPRCPLASPAILVEWRTSGARPSGGIRSCLLMVSLGLQEGTCTSETEILAAHSLSLLSKGGSGVSQPPHNRLSFARAALRVGRLCCCCVCCVLLVSLAILPSPWRFFLLLGDEILLAGGGQLD